MGIIGKIYPKVLRALELVHRFIRSIPLLGNTFDAFTRELSCLLAFYAGCYTFESKTLREDRKSLKLYSYVGCPFCRKVDVVVSLLALDVEYFACPRTTFKKYGSITDSRFRKALKDIGGKAQFPYMVDDNTDESIYESEDIAKYLIQNYSTSKTLPKSYSLMKKYSFTLFLRNLFRPLQEDGLMAVPSSHPKEKLVLWGRFGDSGTMKARETLTSLEQNYIFRTLPFGANDKIKLFQKLYPKNDYKKCLLVDGDEERVISGGKKVSDYLFKTYGKGSKKPKENFSQFSSKGAKKGHAVF